MKSLDNVADIKKYDKGRILDSISSFNNQITQTVREFSEIHIPPDYSDIENVVISGMGGSALGARTIKSLTTGSTRVPVEIINDYSIPNYVNQKTLFVSYSYSGDTEETISSMEHARLANAKIFIITTGGRLAQFHEQNIPAYIFNPSENPSGQPRMGTGYAIASVGLLLDACGVINFPKVQLESANAESRKYIQEFDPQSSTVHNFAKRIAEQTYGKFFIIFASEHLIGASYTFKNQLNECSKTFSNLFEVPESNHHLLEGLTLPRDIKLSSILFTIESPNYFQKIKRRYEVLSEIFRKQEYKHISYTTRSSVRLAEVLELIIFGSYLSYYLAYLSDVDPSVIPWVDTFKSKLSH